MPGDQNRLKDISRHLMSGDRREERR